MAAVSKNGEPLPWYTYPCIDFLRFRTYEDKNVLEFGGGQSTIWWAKRAQSVVTFEGNEEWHGKIKNMMPENVHLHYVSMDNREEQVLEIQNTLKIERPSKYEIIVIDGLFRYEMIRIAISMLAENGIIICDNSEGYGFYEGFKDSDLKRVDFYGNAPGVILPHCTSIYYRSNSFVFDSRIPIQVIAKE